MTFPRITKKMTLPQGCLPNVCKMCGTDFCEFDRKLDSRTLDIGIANNRRRIENKSYKKAVCSRPNPYKKAVCSSCIVKFDKAWCGKRDVGRPFHKRPNLELGVDDSLGIFR